MVKYVTVLLFVACLTACGFKLRGVIDIPTWLHNVALVAEDGNTDVFSPLKAQLQANDIHVNMDVTKADYLIVIIHTYQDQQITGVAASTTPRQYQLTYRVDFTLKTPQGLVKMPPSRVLVTRQITINNERILGSNDEVNLILDEMRRDIAAQILNKLAALRT